jgi:MOSC domain-containing protein
MRVIGRVKELWRYPVKSMGGERLQAAMLTERGIPGDRGWALRDEKSGEVRGAKKMPALMGCAAGYLEEPTGSAIPPARVRFPDGASVLTTDPAANDLLSKLLGRSVTIWPQQPVERRDFYLRHPDNPDFTVELREMMGRLPDEPLPDFSGIPPEVFEFTSPLGTFFDAFPLHLLTTASLRELAAHNPSADLDVRRFRPNVLIESDDSVSGFAEAEWSGREIAIGDSRIALTIPTMRCVMTTLAQEGLRKDSTVLRTIVRDAAQNLGIYANVAQPGKIALNDPVTLL